jgi:hypothetical protein
MNEQVEQSLLDWIASEPNIAAGAAIFIVIIVMTVSYAWVQIRTIQSNNRLKRDMLDRGMSPKEIEQVMQADKSVIDKIF